MAQSLLELGISTGKWDSGLKKAQSSLNNFIQAQGGLNAALGKENAKITQFVGMMGKMESTAKTAKGQMNDYKGSIEQLSAAYNRMTDAQKQSIGPAYLQAIDSMKEKFREAKQQVDALNQSMNGIKAPEVSTGGFLGGMGGKLDGMLQVFGGNLMTKAAGAVANLASEMGDMVKQGIEMARAGEGIRNAFDRLNQPGILDNLREATHGTVTDIELMKAAVKFNDFRLPLDQLGTMLAFAQQKAKDTGQSVDYMVDSIVTGLGRKSLMILDNLGLSASEIKEKMAETGDMTKAVGEIIRDQMSKAGDYVETAADRAAQANVSLQNKMEELGRKFQPLQEASNNLWTSMKIGIMDIVGGPLTDFLNKLTQAGRLANAYGVLGGNAKVGRMLGNLGDGTGNAQSIYKQQQEQFWRYINPREQQIKDIRAWQSGDRSKALESRIGTIRDKYGSLDATKIQAEVDAAKKMLGEYQQAAKSIFNPANNNLTETATTTPKKGGSGGTTPAQRAAENIKTAEQEYARALEKAALEVQGGTITEAQQKQKQLQATEALWTAYGKASDMVNGSNQDYKTKQAELGQRIVELGGEAKSLQDAQKQAEEAYRQVAAQTQKLANAQEEANKAISSGDLKSFYAADKKIVAAGGQSATTGADMSQIFGATTGNIDAFIANLKERIASSEVGTDLYNSLTAQLADASMLGNMIQLAVKNGVDMSQFDPKTLWTKIFGENPGDYIDDAKWEEIRLKLEEIIGKPITIDVNTGGVKEVTKDAQAMSKEWQGAGMAIQAVGNAMSQIEDPAAKVMGTIAQAIASVALGYATASTQAAAMGPWAWIAFAATGLATMISMVSGIHSATGYANGGIVDGRGGGFVGGAAYSGDQVGNVRLDSGELVLNRAQQGNLASQLEGGGMQNLNLTATIKGEDIRLSLNNNGRRTGRGEYVTTNFR